MKKQLKQILLSSLALVAGLLIYTKVNAAKLPIYDMSEWQGNITATQAKKLKTEVGGVILRTGYGSAKKDNVIDHNIAMVEKYNIPYGVYQFGQYTSTSDARSEAKSTYNRAKRALFYVNDAEMHTTSSFSTATQAWGKTMQSLTSKSVYLYSYRSFYNSYIGTKKNYDGFWLAAYTSVTPTPKDYQLWQYSSTHYSSALAKSLDASKQISGNWFGKSASVSTSTYPYGGRFNGETAQVRKAATFYGSNAKLVASLQNKNLVIKQTKTIKSGKSRQAVLLYNGSTVIGWFRAQDVQPYYHASYVKKLKVTNKTGIYTYLNGKRAVHYKKGQTLAVGSFKLVNGMYKAVHKGHTTTFTANKYFVKWVK